jgi:DNA polymerase-3 subunit gamma/tau
MMATTELQNVPITIQSRSQVFELRALPFTAIREQLRTITDREGVRIDDGALALVARSAEGSMRDALSSLDQILAFTSDAVTAADVSTVLGLIGRDLQFDIAEAVAREDLSAAFSLAATVVESGFDLRVVCRELARLMRDLLVIRIDPTRVADPEIAAEGEGERLKALAAAFSREDLMRTFDLLSRSEYEIRQSSQPRHQFEMTLVKWIHLRHLTPLSDLIDGTGATSPGRGAAPRVSGSRVLGSGVLGSRVPGPAATAPRSGPPTAAPPAAPPAAPAAPPPVAKPMTKGDLESALLGAIREQNKVFHGMVIAQAQKVEIEGDAVVFTFAPVHKSLKAQLETKRAWIEQLAQSAAGRRIAVVTRESEAAPPAVTAEADAAKTRRADLTARAKAEPTVQAVLDVFGGEIEDVEEISE